MLILVLAIETQKPCDSVRNERITGQIDQPLRTLQDTSEHGSRQGGALAAPPPPVISKLLLLLLFISVICITYEG